MSKFGVNPAEAAIESGQTDQSVGALADDVRAKGDVFDRTDWLKRLPAAGVTAKIGAGLVGLTLDQAMVPGDVAASYMEMPYVVAVAGAVFGASKVASRLNRHRQAAAYEKQLALPRLLHERTGLELEVFRERKTKKLDLAWYGQEVLPAEGLSTALHDIAAVAEEMGAEYVTITEELIEDYATSDISERAVNRRQWLHERKRHAGWPEGSRPEEGPANAAQKVISLSREELLDIEERAKQGALHEPLDSLMRILRHVQPRHPALRFYSTEQSGQPIDQKRLERSLRMSIERRLSDVEAHQQVDEDGIRHKAKAYLSGSPRLGRTGQLMAEWRSTDTNLRLRTEDLLRQMKIPDNGLVEILRNWQQYPPQRVVELCELAGWLTAKGAPFELPIEGLGPTADGDIATDTAYIHLNGLQKRVGQMLFLPRNKQRQAAAALGINLDPARNYRVLRSCAAVGLVGLAACVGGSMLDSHFDVNSYRDRQPQFGSDAYDYLNTYAVWDPQAQFDQMRDRALEWSGLSMPKSADERRGFIDGHKFHTSQDNLGTNNETVGNVPAEGKNNVMWNIHSFNGMGTEGYWTDSVLDGLMLYGTLQWHEIGNLTIQAEKLSPASQLDPTTQQLLKVEGPVGLGAPSEHCLQIGSKAVNCVVLDVPVLKGSRIASAHIAGLDVQLQTGTLDNGQQVLLMPTEDAFIAEHGYDALTRHDWRLEYWLAPGEPEPVHAALPLFLDVDLGMSQGSITDRDYRLAGDRNFEPTSSRIWMDATKADLPADPKQQLAFEQNYIQWEFTYALAPFKGKVPAGYDTYMRKVLAGKEANCNVANTLLAMSNPEELVAAAGYMNSNGDDLPPGESILSAHEAHLWTVDTAGEIHDATPSGELTRQEQDFFKETYDRAATAQEKKDQRWADTKRDLILAGGLLGAAGVLARRKRLIARGQALRRTTGKAYIRSLRSNRLSRSYEAVSHALWAPEDDTLQFSKNQTERDTTLNKFLQYAQNGQTSQVLSQLSRANGSSSYRRSLRRGSRILKIMHAHVNRGQ